MKKFIDLHLHLDGAITKDIAKKLAAVQQIELPAKEDEELEKLLTVPADCTSLNDFLKCFALPGALMQTREGISEAVVLVAENIKNQGVIYGEFRFAPQLHTGKGLSQREVVEAALSGVRRAAIPVNLILCAMRGEGNEAQNEETLLLAKEYLVEDGGVTGFDLAGAEALFKTSCYGALFEKARKLGVPYTIHAGEADGADSVRTAISFGTKRIGHGVRSFEDPEVLEMLREKGIILEMCPTSNRQTHAVENMENYPFMDYLQKGIKVTLNTDDMAIEGTTLPAEYRYMEEVFGLTKEQEKELLRNSVEAAFTGKERKVKLLKELGL